MAKSRILWYTLAGWSAFVFVLIMSMHNHYTNEIAAMERMGWNAARAAGLDPSGKASAAALGFWILLLLFVWFCGALPLFISAVVTRNKKGS